MHLRLNALVFVMLTALVAILGAWSGEDQLQNLWLLPLALLLLGLAYEGWVVSRARPSLTIDASAQGILGRAMTLQLMLRQELGRSASIELAPAAPEAIQIDASLRTVVMPAGAPVAVEVRATPRRLGQHVWPSMQARVAGPMGLAWWSRRLDVNYTMKVMPELLRDGARRSAL